MTHNQKHINICLSCETSHNLKILKLTLLEEIKLEIKNKVDKKSEMSNKFQNETFYNKKSL